MRYLRAFLVYSYAFLALVFGRPYLFYVTKLMEKDYEIGMRKLYDFARHVVFKIMNLAGAELVVKGQENVPSDGSVLYVGNHQSNFDIVAMIAAVPRPAGFIAKSELAKIPFLSKWALGIGSMFIPRGETRKSLEVIINAIKFLKTHNHGIIVFPEGTRSQTGEVGKFKAGSLKMATKSNATLVPFVINGTREVMGKGKGTFMPNTVTIEFLPSYLPSDLKGLDTTELAENLEKAIREKVQSV